MGCELFWSLVFGARLWRFWSLASVVGCFILHLSEIFTLHSVSFLVEEVDSLR